MFKIYSLEKSSFGDLAKFEIPISKNAIRNILADPFYHGEMLIKKYDKRYPHKYGTLISKELFDECQKITAEREKGFKRQKPERIYIQKSLITCATAGRVVTCDRKGGKKNKMRT